jgi:hypothetical protein
MKMNTQHRAILRSWFGFRALLILLVAAVGLSVGTAAVAGHSPVPGHSNAFGQSLGDWLVTYWRWYYEGTPLPTDRYGNTVVGNVVLLPIPSTDGQGEPGFQDVTLTSGEAFVLPFFGAIGWEYPDGSLDPLVPLSLFETLEITVTVDGVVVIDEENVMDYYAYGEFDPPIPYPPFPEYLFVFLQSVGMAHSPLSVGEHVLTLDVQNTEAYPPEYGGGFSEYHNTWYITVKPGK